MKKYLTVRYDVIGYVSLSSISLNYCRGFAAAVMLEEARFTEVPIRIVNCQMEPKAVALVIA